MKFSKDLVESINLHASIVIPKKNESGYHRLWSEVMLNAIRDAAASFNAQDPQQRSARTAADSLRAWAQSETDCVGSISYCCLILGLDISHIRSIILALLDMDIETLEKLHRRHHVCGKVGKVGIIGKELNRLEDASRYV